MHRVSIAREARRLGGAALLLVAGACAEHTALGPDAAPRAPLRDVSAAAAFDGRIRIGVVPSAASVTIGSAADYTITDRGTGAVLMSGTNGTATVTLATVSQTDTWYRLQVMCGSDAAVATLQAAAESRGYPTLTEPVPAASCTRLYIGKFDPPPASNFAARSAFRNQLLAEGLAGSDSFWKVVTIILSSAAYQVARGAEVVTAPNPVVLASSDGIVTIDGTRYRGLAEVRVNGSGTLLAGVNDVDMEEYLWGVVPRELSPALWPELEALKAQAVAARTYALVGIGKRAAEGYDLLPTTSDQVYGGYDAEQAMSTRAVNETRGVVATHAGSLISTLYSSTSGGHTANNEEVFASAPIAYLRGVPDAERGQALAHVPTLEVFRAHPAPHSLRAEKSGDFEGDWSRYHRWTFAWSAAEISAVLSAWAGQAVGTVHAINVLQRGPSGRVLGIEYVTDAGTFTDTKDRIRASLKYLDASGTPTNLPSTLFFIEPRVDRTTGETGFVAYGGGFGHGVGLSQTGAVGMAARNHDYRAILAHYYRGVELEQRW